MFGGVAGLVLLAAGFIWGLPYYRSVRESKEAWSIYQQAGLPVKADDIFHSDKPDHVSPILEEIESIRKDPTILELHWQGEPYSDEVKYSARFFTQIHFRGHSLWKENKWNLPESKLVDIHRFCTDPRTQKTLSLLREAARYDYRNGMNDWEFHGAWLPDGQDKGREYLKYLLIDQSRIAKDDPSKGNEIFQTLLLIIKMEDLLVQGYTYSHYEERLEHCVEAFKAWMRFDRAYGTPSNLIDDLSNCMNPRKEEEIWLKCHDRERVFDLGHTQQYYDHASDMSEYSRSSKTWKSFISVKIPDMKRKSFERIDAIQDYSFFLRQSFATRGVTSHHLQAAREKDKIFKERNENGVLFMPPYHEIYIRYYHELMMWHEILLTGLAINSYADANGFLPKSLDDLVPGYLPSAPQDRFPIEAPRALKYVVQGNVFELRSTFSEIAFLGRRTR